jgi:hypothetical protein
VAETVFFELHNFFFSACVVSLEAGNERVNLAFARLELAHARSAVDIPET